ncbi:hypothetical protein POUND7_018456 [Theobroma cacao]
MRKWRASRNQATSYLRFLDSGIYRFPTQIPSSSTRFACSTDPTSGLRYLLSAYYSRFFESKHPTRESALSSNPKKRKRKRKKQPHSLNEKEQAADQRHQEARPLLLKAHELLLGAADFPAIMSKLRSEFCSSTELCGGEEHSFIELGRVWQAPLYDITLDFKHSRLTNESENGGLVR